MQTNSAPVLASQAAVKTCSVDVKVIRIGAKQMTLSVFKQLYRQTIIEVGEDGSCRFAGTPWGLVNYYSVCRGIPPGHLHVVWQKGAELRRACVEPPREHSREPDDDGFDDVGHLGTSHFDSLISSVRLCAGLRVGLSRPGTPAKPKYSGHTPDWIIDGLARFRGDAGAWSELVAYWKARERPDGSLHGYYGDLKEKLRGLGIPLPGSAHEAYRQVVLHRIVREDERLREEGIVLFDGEPDEVIRQARTVVEGLQARRRRLTDTYRQCYEQLASLDQLFIAV